MKNGIDISKWQGTVDFAKVKADGVEFIIIRSSYRQSVDPKFYEYIQGCKLNEIPVLGIYHFIYALDEQQALAEAIFCVEQAKNANLSKDSYIFSDFEYDSVKKALEKRVVLTRTECNKFTQIFCEYVESQGYKAGIYTNRDYYKNWYDHELLSKYDLWLADYTGGPDYECVIQQYTSSGVVDGINTKVDMNYLFNKDVKFSRQILVNLALSWEGKKETDGSYKDIIDIYNSYNGPFPRGIKMNYDWAWCACTWSALAIKLGYTDIIPIEISCGYLIEAAKRMGVWQENDDYIAQPGDAVLYDWNDNGNGDNNSWPDHVGVIVETHQSAGYFVVMEGNYNDSVKKRTLSINGKYIRGFITPKYDDNTLTIPAQSSGKDIKTIAHEVIAGKWGSGEARKVALEKVGYDYKEVQSMVNQILNGDAVTITGSIQNNAIVPSKKITASCAAKNFDKTVSGTYVTTANLYCRNDAGTNKKALCCIPKDTKVNCYGYYTIANDTKWLYIQFIVDGVQYTGFSSSKYLKK